MHARNFTVHLLLLALVTATSLQAALPFTGPADIAAAEQVPAGERALRLADTLLLEPGYRRARNLAAEWHRYVSGFVADEKQVQLLENLANERAILYFLRETEGPLAPAFAKEAERVLTQFGNGALVAWRLRSLTGKIVLSHNAERLKNLNTSETKREIGPRFFTVPISGAGFNFSLDAEWDITRLSNYPLAEANSEFLFIQTDRELRLTGRAELRQLPDSAYRFISADRFTALPYLVQNGMRILPVSAGDMRLFICYPFAGYTFYAVRGTLALLLLFALILALRGIRSLRAAATDVMENRQGRWLGEHYEKSLSLNEQALKVTDRSVALVSEIKDRDAALIGELGRKLGEIHSGIEEQTRFLIEEAVSKQKPAPATTVPSAGVQRPLHRKTVPKAPILIDGSAPGNVQVSVELDLPLSDEKQLTPHAKAEYVTSLRRRAREKTGQREYVHDEKIDNYDFIPEEPVALPEKPAFEPREIPDASDLEYVQKFRYTGKPRVLPLEVRPASSASLRMREDLHQQELVVTGEEE
jgi:hypothetical protein